MKLAVFEFEDCSCEIGQTAWIYGEDERLLNNNDWFFSKEVVMRWPKDFNKVARMMKGLLVDPTAMKTERFSAKIVKFGGKNFFSFYLLACSEIDILIFLTTHASIFKQSKYLH